MAANPKIASSYVPGKSFEGRNMTVIVLKSNRSRRSVWIDCGIHAREWVSPAACIVFINNIVEEYKKAPVFSMINYFEFHIMPLHNPDGYVRALQIFLLISFQLINPFFNFRNTVRF